MKTFLPYFFAVASSIAAISLGIGWQRSLAEMHEKDAELQKMTQEIDKLQKQQAEAKAVNDILLKRIKLYSESASSNKVLNELDAAERRHRIPEGATDPDKMWKGQMIRARDTLQRAGMPAGR
jgi:hypothetical protein